MQKHAQLTQKKILDNTALHLKSKNNVNRQLFTEGIMPRSVHYNESSLTALFSYFLNPQLKLPLTPSIIIVSRHGGTIKCLTLMAKGYSGEKLRHVANKTQTFRNKRQLNK